MFKVGIVHKEKLFLIRVPNPGVFIQAPLQRKCKSEREALLALVLAVAREICDWVPFENSL